MNLIFLGPPGSGKGTYASRIATKLGITKISLGDIFREIIKENTKLGRKVAEYYNRGELVPDDIAIEVLRGRLRRPDCKDGFVLDDFPRTLHQAEALDKMTKVDAIIYLKVPDRVAIERLSSRITCKKCQAIYNIRFIKPKVMGVCDKCGGELYQREDDKPDVIKERLREYHKKTKPILNFYKDRKNFATVGTKIAGIDPKIMVNRILRVLKKFK